MPNFKIYGLHGNSVEIMAIMKRVLSVICHVVRQLGLQDDNVITLSSDQVVQAVPGLPPGRPYLEIRSEDPLEMARVVMALEADGRLGIDIEMTPLSGFKNARQMSRQLNDDGGDELNVTEGSSSFSGTKEFDF